MDFFMKKTYLCGKYSVFGCVCAIVLSFFLTHLKDETRSRYPGNCNRVPGS